MSPPITSEWRFKETLPAIPQDKPAKISPSSKFPLCRLISPRRWIRETGREGGREEGSIDKFAEGGAGEPKAAFYGRKEEKAIIISGDWQVTATTEERKEVRRGKGGACSTLLK